MEDIDAVEPIRLRQAGDHATGDRRVGVALGRDDDAHRCVIAPCRLGDVRERARRGTHEEIGQRGVEARKHHLRLGIAEARIELHDTHALRRECKPGVEQPGKGSAATAHLFDRRLQHRAHRLVDQVVGRPRERGVGAHAAGVGPRITVSHALEVLRGAQGHDRDAIGDGEERDLRAVEVLLDDNRRPRIKTGARVVECCSAILGDHDALAGGQAVVFHDVRRSELVEACLDFGDRATHGGSRGRHVRGCHDLLGEGLAPLQACRLCTRPEAGDPTGTHGIGDAGDQRRLRADDDEVRAERLGKIRDRPSVEGVDRMAPRVLCDSGIARCDMYVVYLRVTSQGTHEGMLAGTGSDDQGDHKP